MYAISLLLLSGCLRLQVPPEYRMSPREAAWTTYGAWVAVEIDRAGEAPGKITGELLAVEEADLWVLVDSGKPMRVDWLTVGQLRVYRGRASEVGPWGTLGALSTLSHGGWLIFSAPIWIIGSAVTGGEGRRGAIRDLDVLARVSRFPQGLPEGLDLTSLTLREEGTSEPRPGSL